MGREGKGEMVSIRSQAGAGHPLGAGGGRRGPGLQKLERWTARSQNGGQLLGRAGSTEGAKTMRRGGGREGECEQDYFSPGMARKVSFLDSAWSDPAPSLPPHAPVSISPQLVGH